MGTDEWVAVGADVGEASFVRLDELWRPCASAAELALLRGTSRGCSTQRAPSHGWLNVRTAVTEGDS